MASIDELAQRENVRPNSIVRALCKEHFKELKWTLIHARYTIGPHEFPATINPVLLCSRTGVFKPKLLFNYIRIDPILKTAKTSALIGGIAHELAHSALFYPSRTYPTTSDYDLNTLETAVDGVVVARGLGKHLYELTDFLETIPPGRYDTHGKFIKAGFSKRALSHFRDQ